MQSKIIEEEMQLIGVLPNQLNQNNIPLNSTASLPSSKPVRSKGHSSVVLVNPSVNSGKVVDSSGQLNSTKAELNNTKSQLTFNNINCLSELGQQAKGELEILVATGKTKDLLGKQITQLELDNMSEKEILKYYRVYQSALSVRINDTFGKMAVRSYVKVASWLLPIDSEDDLYHDLRNDYILVNEIDRWTGWLSLKMGSLMALASASLVTIGHCEMKQKSQIINDREHISESSGDNSSD